MSSRRVRTGAAALLASVLALSAVAVFHREPDQHARRHIATLAANLSDTVAPTGKVEQPGAAPAPAAAVIAAGAAIRRTTADSSSIPPIRTVISHTVRGPPRQGFA